MRKSLLPILVLGLGLAACTGGSVGVAGGGVGVNLAGGDYYDGFYDGYYGPFNDGYWGNDGFFWYSDAGRNWHRDDGHHFARSAGNGGNWNHVHGSGVHRDH